MFYCNAAEIVVLKVQSIVLKEIHYYGEKEEVDYNLKREQTLK